MNVLSPSATFCSPWKEALSSKYLSTGANICGAGQFFTLSQFMFVAFSAISLTTLAWLYLSFDCYVRNTLFSSAISTAAHTPHHLRSLVFFTATFIAYHESPYRLSLFRWLPLLSPCTVIYLLSAFGYLTYFCAIASVVRDKIRKTGWGVCMLLAEMTADEMRMRWSLLGGQNYYTTRYAFNINQILMRMRCLKGCAKV